VQQKGLIKELERRFLVDDLMNEIGIIYFQYWEALDAKMTFLSHLAILKVEFHHSKAISTCDSLVVGLLDPTLLNQQAFLFAMTMKSNSHGAL
jgi:hypothetical protein